MSIEQIEENSKNKVQEFQASNPGLGKMENLSSRFLLL